MAAPDVATGNAAGLMAFLDFMIAKGYGTAGSISPWKSAAKNVFVAMEGEDFGGFDVRTFDVEDYLARFENRSMGKYTADSLSAYRARFRKAIDAYRSYLADPNWKPAGRRAPARAAGDGAASRAKKAPSLEPSGQSTGAPASSLIAYPFPLRSGQVAQLHLPTQLDRDDAERLTHFIRALVFDQPRQITAGQDD